MEAKTDFEVICAFVLLKAAIKVAEQSEDVALLSALNQALIPFEFAFNLIKERQNPNIKRRNWIGGFVDGSNAIVDTPPFIHGGEKVISASDLERIYKQPCNQWGLND